MYINFYYINSKKEKKNYLMVYKSDEKSFPFETINSLLFDKLNNLSNNLSNINEQNNAINYFELFYIKKGLSITYNENKWHKLISIYLKNIELQYLIDEEFIKKIYYDNIILFLLDDYKQDIKDFLINYYEKSNN